MGGQAGTLLLSAFQAGGEDAKHALAALIWYQCSISGALQAAWSAFLDLDDLYKYSSVMT